MLLTIHVKNFALIDEVELSLGQGVQILTGETGAGKSILIDAVTAALGGKVSKDMVRRGADYALVELVFEVFQEDKRKALEEMEIPVEDDGLLIVSRRISSEGRSICKVNGVTTPLGMVRQATGLLIDIHGQHEHQSLLYKTKHLEILDDYIHHQTAKLRRELERSYEQYMSLKKELASFDLDEDARRRELDFCRYEIQELEQARTEAEAAVKQMMQEAEARAAQTTARVLEQAGEDCELLKQNARTHLDEAVQLIVERVVNR